MPYNTKSKRRFKEMTDKNYPKKKKIKRVKKVDSAEKLKKYGPKPKIKRVKRRRTAS